MLKTRLVAQASRSAARVYEVVNRYGVKLETPVYAVKAEDVGRYIEPPRLAELKGLVEVNIGSVPLRRQEDIMWVLDQATRTDTPYYVAIKPTLVVREEKPRVEALLGKISELIEENEQTYLTTLIPDEVFVKWPEPAKKFCARHTCTYMLATSLQKMNILRERLDNYNRLVAEGIVDASTIALSYMKTYTLSQRRQQILARVRIAAGPKTLLIVYGPLTAKMLRTNPFIGIANELAQYHIGVDITGPTRAPAGAPQAEPKKRLLLPDTLLYIDLKALQQNDKHTLQLLQQTINQYQDLAPGPQELSTTPQTRLEIHNIEKRLEYTVKLRTEDPDNLLEKTLDFYKRNSLEEAYQTILKAVNYAKTTIRQQKLHT